MKLLTADRPFDNAIDAISINDAPTLILDPDPVSSEVPSSEATIAPDLIQQPGMAITQLPKEYELNHLEKSRFVRA